MRNSTVKYCTTLICTDIKLFLTLSSIVFFYSKSLYLFRGEAAETDEPPGPLPEDITTGGVRTGVAGSVSGSEGGLLLSSFGDSEYDGDESEGLPLSLDISGMGGSARSGFGGGRPLSRASSLGSVTDRRSRRLFRPEGQGDQGTGGGAMEVLKERSMETPVDNSAHVTAGGQVVDTGIGAIPALDLARQQVQQDIGAGGVEEEKGRPQEDLPQEQLQLQEQTTTEGLWPEEDDLEVSETPKYMIGREELENSLGEDRNITESKGTE